MELRYRTLSSRLLYCLQDSIFVIFTKLDEQAVSVSGVEPRLFQIANMKSPQEFHAL
jgi:hypothetical protein